MHVFVTGASGWVGSALVDDLIGAGHRVSGLVRSDTKAAALEAAGATAVRGSLDDLDGLRAAADSADAVVHTAFNHDFSKFAESAEQDRRAIEAIGSALAGSDRPLIVTGGVAALAAGRVSTEADMPGSSFPRQSDAAIVSLRAHGLRAASVRLSPSTHGVGETHGFVPILARIAREKGVSAYVGDGDNRWPGVHRLDAARLYRLVLESRLNETVYHAVAEEGVPFKAIAEAIGRQLGLPVAPREPEHFGWFGMFAGLDMAASSVRTREVTGWQPTGPGLIEDIDQPAYFAAL